MANLQVKNVPDALHRKLRQRAKREGRTLRDIVLDAVSRDLARVEFRERLGRRDAVDLGGPAARLVDEERAARERDL